VYIPLNSPSAIDNKNRIVGLDVARGFALLGILIMNSTGMALYSSAYFNYASDGGEGIANFIAWSSMIVYFEGAMRGLFSLLFGAGIVIFLDQLNAKNVPNAIDIHGRRMLLLIGFGLINTFVFFYPFDILLFYGMAGLALFPLRNLSIKSLSLSFIVLFIASNLFSVHQYHDRTEKQSAFEAAKLVLSEGKDLTDKQQNAIDDWEKSLDYWAGTEETRKKDNWVNNKNHLEFASKSWSEYSSSFASSGFWRFLFDSLFMVTLGMLLTKLGVLAGTASNSTYIKMLFFGYSIGIGFGLLRAKILVDSDYSFDSFSHLTMTYQIRRIAMSIGHVGLIFCMVRFGLFSWLQSAFSALGRMAFTNYMAQSVFQVLIWYGPGLSLHGRVERYEVWIAITLIWIVQVAFSIWWLKHYKMGPLEWVWRAMTYGTKPELKIKPIEPVNSTL
jgi:uncharacterized protein